MLTTVLGGLLGFLGSAIGPALEFFTKKENNKLEMQKMEMASRFQQAGWEHDKVMYLLTARDQEHQRLIEHDIAISQGSGFLSFLQRSVRPVITYFFFALFAAVELTLLQELVTNGSTFSVAIQHVWDEQTQALFATVMTFWFGNRVFEKLRVK